MLSIMLVPQASPAQIISLCPMLLEDGTCTVPRNLLGKIFTLFIMLTPNIPAPAANLISAAHLDLFS